ncbi:DNA mismatch repair protein MutS [Aquimarina sp. ERC-38]|uniref:DNA mismatch repair protein MutS n=1 Tax=Aquimarina sp. ERC-38 TaxID=2949996 RepID=UPI00224662C5|nr:DNA mismatch repair protein MutS [Aquimarina sp. ERC-38]UZO79537.1 DNA mismatch repair protein MutS [Aquimarina sp. ERC-38]
MKIGDKVSVLDDPITGVITKVENDQIIIRTEDGFEMEFTQQELVVEHSTLSLVPSLEEITDAVQDKEHFKKKSKKPLITTKKKEIPAMEVDLHIHKLTESSKGMSNYDMLNLQLETAKRQLQFAIEKRISRVIFIHGVGQGVLKEELRYEFSKYDGIKVSDADYQKYGLGAMEIYIYQNPDRK